MKWGAARISRVRSSHELLFMMAQTPEKTAFLTREMSTSQLLRTEWQDALWVLEPKENAARKGVLAGYGPH